MQWRAASVLLLWFLAFLLSARSLETTLTISVRNEQDKPVDNAAVILDFRGGHQIMKLGKRKPTHWEMHTNQEGIAHFPPIPQGTVQIQIIANRYQTYGRDVDLDTDEKKLDIKLNRPQKQYSAHEPTSTGDNPKQ